MTPISVSGDLVRRVAAARNRLVRQARRVLAVWFVAAAALVLVLAWAAAGGEGWSQGSRWPLLLDGTLLLVTAAAIGVLVRWARTGLTEARVAREMEEGSGLVQGAVGGPLELTRHRPPGVSAALVAHGARLAIGRLPAEETAPAGSLGLRQERFIRRGVASLAVVAVLALVLAGLAPGRALSAWAGLLSPIRLAAAPVLPPMAVIPGDVEVLRGTTLEVEIEAPLRDSVQLAWREPGQVPGLEVVATPAGFGVSRFVDVRTDFQYSVQAPDGDEAGPFTVSVLDPLVLTDLTLQLLFPAHTGLGTQEIRGDPPTLRLPRGTVVEVEGRWSRLLSEASLRMDDPDGEADAVDPRPGASTVLSVDEDRVRGEWVPNRTGQVAWEVRDLRQREPEEPAPPFFVEIVEDAAPEIRFVIPAQDTTLPVSRRQPLVLEATDDYGIRFLEIEAVRISSLGRRGEPVIQRMDAGDSRQLLFRPVLDVSGWDLLPGDTVRVIARVVDNRPGGMGAQSRELSLWLPNEAELRHGAGDQIDEAADLLEQLALQAGELGEETRALERQAEAGERGGAEGAAGLEFGDREDLRSALEQEEALLNAVDSLAMEMEALAGDLQEAGLPDPELQAELEELQRLMEEVAGDDLRARMDSLAENLDDMSAREAAESLEEMSRRQEELREQLQESLERFRKAAAEQELRAVTSEAEDLAREGELLSEALETAAEPEALEDARQSLEERTEDLSDRMEALEQRMAEVGDQDAGERAREAGEKTQNAGEMLQKAGEQMQSGDQQEASETAGEAAEELDEAAQQLQQAQEDMAQRQAEALQQALARATNDALALARRQSDLREEIRSAAPAELPGLRGDQADLMQGLRNLAEQAAITTQAAPGIAEELSSAIGSAMQRAQASVEALERAGRGSGPSPFAVAEATVEGMNRIALMAMAGSEALANQPSGSPEQQMAEQLQQLAQQQGQLMNQTEQVMPMELTPEQMEQQTQQIAEGQEQVAGELGEMADEPGKSDEVLGDLEALAELAAALAKEMAEGRLQAETLDRQEELFHRLLDAGRSLEKDEFAEERQSEAPQDVIRERLEALDLEALGGERIRFPTREELQGLTPAERQLILQYFERLSRGRARTGGGGGS